MDIVWGDKETNLRRVEEFVATANAELVVLPEMFATGYDCMPAPVAEKMDGFTIKRMREIARSYDCALLGSVIVEEAGRYLNRAIFAHPDGRVECYDKRHLFHLAGEGKTFARGHKRVVVEYRGWRILPLICYDLRFPVWSRLCDDYDLIIYGASWEDKRISSWDRLLPARAIENQAYVMGANRVGSDPISHYPGHSVILSPLGDVIASAGEGEEAGLFAELDGDVVQRFRERFPAAGDADQFEIYI